MERKHSQSTALHPHHFQSATQDSTNDVIVQKLLFEVWRQLYKLQQWILLEYQHKGLRFGVEIGHIRSEAEEHLKTDLDVRNDIIGNGQSITPLR
jgi:hypothetical protein